VERSCRPENPDWNSFVDYSKNLEKLSDEKKENKSGKVRHSSRRQSPAFTTVTFDGAMNFPLLHWVVKGISLKLLPASY
jgi:hypothetical protein